MMYLDILIGLRASITTTRAGDAILTKNISSAASYIAQRVRPGTLTSAIRSRRAISTTVTEYESGMAGSPTLSSAVHRSRYVGEANASCIVICDPGAVGPRKSSRSTDRNDLGASTREPRTVVRIIRTMSAGPGREALATPGRCPADEGLAEDLREWFRGELPISDSPFWGPARSVSSIHRERVSSDTTAAVF